MKRTPVQIAYLLQGKNATYNIADSLQFLSGLVAGLLLLSHAPLDQEAGEGGGEWSRLQNLLQGENEIFKVADPSVVDPDP
jgi:hypothetical protein